MNNTAQDISKHEEISSGSHTATAKHSRLQRQPIEMVQERSLVADSFGYYNRCGESVMWLAVS